MYYRLSILVSFSICPTVDDWWTRDFMCCLKMPHLVAYRSILLVVFKILALGLLWAINCLLWKLFRTESVYINILVVFLLFFQLTFLYRADWVTTIQIPLIWYSFRILLSIIRGFDLSKVHQNRNGIGLNESQEIKLRKKKSPEILSMSILKERNLALWRSQITKKENYLSKRNWQKKYNNQIDCVD